MTFALIDAVKALFPITLMYLRLGADVELVATIREIHATSRGSYGVLRVTAELPLGHGWPVNRNRLARLMALRAFGGSPDAEGGVVRSPSL